VRLVGAGSLAVTAASPTRQELLELVEQLALVASVVEPMGFAKLVVRCIVRLEILAACDASARQARRAYQIGQALLRVCEDALSGQDGNVTPRL
jgi:hypothetical protein